MKIVENLWAVGTPPRTPPREHTALRQAPETVRWLDHRLTLTPLFYDSSTPLVITGRKFVEVRRQLIELSR